VLDIKPRIIKGGVSLIRSMTGYGKGESENQLYKLKIELKSVNHRYLDVNLKLPRYLIYLEEGIKKLIKEKINRGKVDVFVNFDFSDASSMDVKVDIPLARSFKFALEELKTELEIDDTIRLNNILSISDVIKTEKKELDEDLVWETIKEATEEALDKILQMREYEGEQLKADIFNKLDNIEAISSRIEMRAPLVVEEYRGKLNERIQSILEEGTVVDPDRLAMEVAIYADKSSIDEELTRLKSHVLQLKAILSEDGAVGRKLDFLIQEFNREVNTIGSKSSDSDIVKAVVELKSEIEKIREQVQNIE
jgi:uncharacterized protein (TIGR00255 family)